MVTFREETVRKAKRKRDILIYIYNFRLRKGYGPTYAQIGAKFGIKSPSIQQYYIEELIQDGWLRRTPGVARSLVPVYPVDVLYPLPD